VGFLQKIFYWEQRKLGDYGSVKMNKRIFKNQTSPNGDIPFYKIGTFGKKADSFISKKLYEKYKVKYPYPKIGDLLISASGSIGRIIEYKGKKAYFQDSNIVWLSHNSKLLNIYLKQYYQRINWNNIEGTTIKRLYNKDILTTHISVPNIKEQKRIGNLLNLVDNLLVLQKRKYKELKLLKKALLQNMFANKSLYPKLRFKGFTDKWKQEKLNSIASLLNGRAYKRNELLNSGKYPVLRVGNFYTNDKWYFSNLELKTNKYAIKGDLLYTWSATFGPHIWTGKKVIYHYHIWKIILKNNVDKFFVYEFLKEDRDQLLRNTNGSTMIHITKSNMENKYISLPNKKGQKKIGNFFKKFDNLIIAQNKKYNELKFIKKFLLQNMFI
jgi:type I restriction enzyme S subunit